jgi:hypothetical protein
VGGQNHVHPSFEDLNLFGDRTRGSTQVRLSDQVEHQLLRRCHLDDLGTQRTDPPANADIYGNSSRDQAEIATADQRKQASAGKQPGTSARGQAHGCPPDVDASRAPGAQPRKLWVVGQ